MRKILPLINIVLAAILVYILIYPQIQARKIVQVTLKYEQNLSALPLFVAQEMGYFDSLRVKATIEEVAKPGSEVDEVTKSAVQAAFGLSGDEYFFKTGPRPSAYRLIYTCSSSEGLPQTALFVKRPPKRRRRRRRTRIKGIKDLVGKRIGFLRGTHYDEILKYIVRKEELDPEKFHFTPLSGFEMDSALQKDLVDALVAVEPYRTILLNKPEEVKLVEDGFFEKHAITPFLLGVGFTSRVNIQLKRNATQRIIKAISMALKYIRTHPDSAVIIANNHLETPTDLVFPLPNYQGYNEIEIPGLIRWASFMKDANILLFDVDVEAYLLRHEEMPK